MPAVICVVAVMRRTWLGVVMQHWFTYPTYIDPVAIRIGPVGVHWYGIAYLVAFICVYLWMSRPAGRRRLGLTKEQIQDFLFYALVGVLVGGRTFFVINDIISKHDASFYLSAAVELHRGLEWRNGVSRRPYRRHDRHLALRSQASRLEVHRARRRGRDDAAGGHHARPHRQLHQRRVVGRSMHSRPRVVPDLSHRTPGQRKRRLPSPIADLRSHSRYSHAADAADRSTGSNPKTASSRGRGSRSTASRARIAELWRHADFTWMGITGGQLYALPMIAIGIVGIVYCATRPGSRHRGRARLRFKPRADDAPPPSAISALRREIDDEAARAADATRLASRSSASTKAASRRHGSRSDRGRACRHRRELSARGAGKARAACRRVRKHFIGHVQTNKAKAIAAAFDVVQSVDRIEPERRFRARRRRPDKQLARAAAAQHFARRALWLSARRGRAARRILRGQPGLRFEGIMAIGPARRPTAIAISERRLSLAAKTLGRVGGSTLSIGMSGDWREAVRAGSTMVRIGKPLFGAHAAPKEV